MKILKHIKSFKFGYAQYHLKGKDGLNVLLKIDYRNNNYSVENMGEVLEINFRKEISELALDLLRRKHNVNFARKW